MVDWAMHAKESGRRDPFTEKFAAADDDSTAGVVNGYQPGVGDVAQKVAVTSFSVQSE